MLKTAGIVIAAIVGVVALVAAVLWAVDAFGGGEIGHYNVKYELQTIKIQGVERTYFAQKEPIPVGVDTFHMVLPGGVVSTSTPVRNVTEGTDLGTPTPFQPIESTGTVTATAPSNLIMWRVINPSGCTCEKRNEAGDAIGALTCTDGSELPGGTSLMAYCPANKNNDFYFEKVTK